MRIYVGRWDLLPESWEGINGLYEKSEEEIDAETKRQQEFLLQDTGYEDDFVGNYYPEEFEDSFNQCLTRFIDSRDYWIKIF
jgi:hypothetical protein